jgi:hypothetical protein
VPSVSNDLEAYTDYRELMALYDRVINLTAAQTSSQVSANKDFPEQSVGDFRAWRESGYESLHIKANENTLYDCVEVDAVRNYSGEDLVYFSADVYSSFASFFWETSITLPEFIKLVRRFVGSATRWKVVNGFVLSETPRKLFNGLYIYLADGVKHIPLHRDTDLSQEFLASKLDPHWKVRFIRVGLLFADLCYDFQAVDGLPQRAGILSHMPCRDAIADFIHWSNSRYAPRLFVVGAVGDTLSQRLKHE